MTILVQNPASGLEIARIPAALPLDVPRRVAEARASQAEWACRPIRDRLRVVARFAKILARDADLLAQSVTEEVGKPRSEALIEVTTTLDAVRWTARNAAHWLADARIDPGWQRLILMGSARVRWRPWGVIAILGTWNYPLLVDVPAICQAIASGNAVAWKPSELSARAATLVHQRLREAGVPEGLVALLIGGAEVGSALIRADVDKGVFTGGIRTGRAVLGRLAARGIPAVAELSGFDPAILLPDADRAKAIKALTWAAFVGAGQTCVGVKRIYVVGDAANWAENLAEAARVLRIGDPSSDTTDVGPMISGTARERFHETIRVTVAAGARLLCGGTPIRGPGWFYPPTVLIADDPAPEIALEGAFGPVVVVRGVASIEGAVAAANARPSALAASVWGRDVRQARRIADRLEAGMVAINDAVTPSGHAASPFGGSKASGFGRMRGALGLREFVQPQAVRERGEGGYRPHLFPYSRRLGQLLALYRRWVHGA